MRQLWRMTRRRGRSVAPCDVGSLIRKAASADGLRADRPGIELHGRCRDCTGRAGAAAAAISAA